MAMSINAKMKISDLVDQNYQVLGMLDRMGINDGFGDRTVEEICQAHSLDPDTFILLYNIYLDKQFKPTDKMLRECSLRDVAGYLHRSHDYYINVALRSLSDSLEVLIEPYSDLQKIAIWRFFNNYKAELEKHFDFEEKQVLPYIEDLLAGVVDTDFNIDSFEDEHGTMGETLSDLKSLVLKSLPDGSDSALRMQTMYLICTLQYDMDRHTCVEETVLEPMVRLLEQKLGCRAVDDRSSEQNDLTDREKEILVGVAQGLLNKEIADKYNISIYTVISHRKNITRKTGIKSVAGLTVYALLNGLIDMSEVE